MLCSRINFLNATCSCFCSTVGACSSNKSKEESYTPPEEVGAQSMGMGDDMSMSESSMSQVSFVILTKTLCLALIARF